MARPSNSILQWAVQDITLPQLGGPNKATPISDLQQKGWDMGQKPAADELNYILNNFSAWITYLDEKTGGTSPTDFAVDSVPNTQAKRDSNGVSCFQKVRGTDNVNAATIDLITPYDAKPSASFYLNNTKVGQFVQSSLATTGDSYTGLKVNTSGIHFGESRGTHTGACIGNADTATKLATPRTIRLQGALSGSGAFDGSNNLTINTALNNYTFDTSSSGYLFLPNPDPSLTRQLLVVWGTFQGDTGAPYIGSVTFPVAFPNQCFGVNFHTNDIWHSNDGNDQVAYDITKNGFTYSMEGAGRKHFYIAIGC